MQTKSSALKTQKWSALGDSGLSFTDSCTSRSVDEEDRTSSVHKYAEAYQIKRKNQAAMDTGKADRTASSSKYYSWTNTSAYLQSCLEQLKASWVD